MSGPLAPITIAGNPNANISEYVMDMSVSLTLDETSEIALTVFDPGLQLLNANYFQVRQIVEYLGMKFEMAAVEVAQGGGGPQVTIQCRPHATQVLKRWKIAEVLNVATATDYAAQKARDVGLAFFAEDSAARQVVNQVNNDKADESVWDVLGRLASELGFVRFEIDGRLFFCSEAFLLGKFGLSGYGVDAGFLSIPVRWNADNIARGQSRRFAPEIPSPVGRPFLEIGASGVEVEFLQRVLRQRASQTITDPDGYFGITTENAVKNLQAFTRCAAASGLVGQMTWAVIDFLAIGIDFNTPPYGTYYIAPVGIPTVRISDDSYVAAEMSFNVEREPGKALRPGMTVNIEGIPGFEGYYLIDSVSWREGTNDYVSVSGRTLVEPKPNAEDKDAELNRFRRSLSLTGGGFAAGDFRPLFDVSG